MTRRVHNLSFFRAVITLDFRTIHPDGVIFYFADTKHVDHISITLTGGLVRFTFNSGTGMGVLMNDKPVNDDQWHTVSNIAIVN